VHPCSILLFVTVIFELYKPHTITMPLDMNAVFNDVVVYDYDYAVKVALEHTKRQLYEKNAIEDSLVAKIHDLTDSERSLIAKVKELEELLKTKATEQEADKALIKTLQKDKVDLRVHNDLLQTQVRECIAAHAGSGTDPDQIEARARFAEMNVEVTARTKYDAYRAPFIKAGIYLPLFFDVVPEEPVGTGNGTAVADRNELHDLLARNVPVFGMEKRAPEGKENIPDNRVKTYFPYSEIEAAQLAFEKLRPKFKANPRAEFKTASADVHHVDRDAPRLHRRTEPSAKVQRAKDARTKEAPKRRVSEKTTWRKK
jgi:hypothetical protein